MKNHFQISHNTDTYIHPVEFHSHDFYEIYFFADGNVTYYIENESYDLKKGDVLVIPPGKLHRPVIEEHIPYERYVLWIYGRFANTRENFSKMLEKLNALIAEKGTRRVSFHGQEAKKLTCLFDSLTEKFHSADEFAFYTAESCIVLIINKIIDELNQSQPVQDENPELIRQVIAYINTNVANAPALEDLTRKFYVSKYYLSHKFKEHTKTSIHRYILMKKISLARQELEKGRTPNEVCGICGFSTYSNFYKEFKKQTGFSPKDYKKSVTIQNPLE